jgi:uncharacterized protein Yka (UPF0111/DUF47 family)
MQKFVVIVLKICMIHILIKSSCFITDIKRKLDRLNSLWNEVQKATNDRGKSLEDTLIIAERFWDELHNVMATLQDLQDSLSSQEPPAVEPAAIQQQQVALQEIRHEIDQVHRQLLFLLLNLHVDFWLDIIISLGYCFWCFEHFFVLLSPRDNDTASDLEI